jgi:hypothetical protein
MRSDNEFSAGKDFKGVCRSLSPPGETEENYGKHQQEAVG